MSARLVAGGIPAVAVPAITSTSISLFVIMSLNPSAISWRYCEFPNSNLLSLYMGIRYPDAHKKGVSGFSCIAPVSIEILAISSENFIGVFERRFVNYCILVNGVWEGSVFKISMKKLAFASGPKIAKPSKFNSP